MMRHQDGTPERRGSFLPNDDFEMSFDRLKAPEERLLTTIVVGMSGKRKILRYNFPKLVRVGAVTTMFSRGTIFNLDKTIGLLILSYGIAFTLASIMVVRMEDPASFSTKSLSSILKVTDNLQRFCPFLFGLFVSLIIGRWWFIRTQAVGAMVDHCINISCLLSSYGARILQRKEDWEDFKKIHNRIVKYGLAALSCIAKESRGGQKSLEELEVQGLLTAEERSWLEDSGNSPATLWCWITALGAEALEMMKVAFPNHNMFFTETRMGIEGVNLCHQYLRTQLPFPYVHMITMLVNVNNMVMATVAGLKFGVALTNNDPFVCMAEVLQFMLVPLLYQGLLQVCVLIGDPLGDDIIDFPILEYQHELNDTCKSMLEHTRLMYEKRFERRQSPLPNAHHIRALVPDKAVSSAAPAPPVVAQPPSAGQLVVQTQFLEQLDRKFEELRQNMDERMPVSSKNYAAAPETHLRDVYTEIGRSPENLQLSTSAVEYSASAKEGSRPRQSNPCCNVCVASSGRKINLTEPDRSSKSRKVVPSEDLGVNLQRQRQVLQNYIEEWGQQQQLMVLQRLVALGSPTDGEVHRKIDPSDDSREQTSETAVGSRST